MGDVKLRSPAKALEAPNLQDVSPYYYDPADEPEARRGLREVKLNVVAQSRLGWAVAGPAEGFSRLTGGRVVTVSRVIQSRAGRTTGMRHLDIVGDDQPRAIGV